MNEEIVKYFQEGVARGNSLDSLRKALVDAGWAPEKVSEVAVWFEQDKKPKDSRKMGISQPRGKRPAGIVVVAILHWLMALAMVAGAVISYIVFGLMMKSVSQMEGVISYGASFLGSIWVLILPIVIAIIPLIVGIAIYKGKIGGKILALIFGIISIILTVISLAQLFYWYNIVGLVISLYIVGYLFFSKNGRAWFKKR